MLSQWQSLLVTIALAVSGAHSAPSGEHGLGAHGCESFTAPIAAKAVNVGNISLNSTGSGTIAVGPGPFKLAFHFCTPSRPTKRAKILQVLVHGASYTHEYWRFGYRPELYSYERVALNSGYSTLSVDLLGCGASDYPDPFNVVQIPLNVQLIKSALQMVRAGTLAPRRTNMPKFERLVAVGHSMGSLILNGVLAAAPNLVNAVVLTGYAHLPSGVPTVANGGIQIASQTFPNRFGSLSDGYAVIANRTLFYGPAGSYEPGVLAHDVATQNTVSVGAAVTLAHGVLPAPGFRGHVLAVNGDSDAGNCVQPGCNSLFDERSYYAAATSFEAHVIPNTGHDVNLHKSAPITFALITNWLTRKGF